MSQVDDFFRSRLDQMIEPRRPLAVLASRMLWQDIEANMARHFARQVKAGKSVQYRALWHPNGDGRWGFFECWWTAFLGRLVREFSKLFPIYFSHNTYL